MEPIESKINSVNKRWSKDPIIRYVIVELAPYFRRDLNYFLSSSARQLELFESGYRPVAPDVFCITLCEHYQRILERFDIRSKIIQASDTGGKSVPLFALIVEGDNGWYYLNPLKDLWSHQLKVPSNEFGIPGYYNKSFIMQNYPHLITLAPEYLEELDQEVGIENNNPCFYPEVIGGKDLNQYRKKKGLDPKAPFVETVISKIGDISEMYLNIGAVHGPIERILMYKYFFTTVFTRPEKAIVKVEMNPEQNHAITIDVQNGEETIRFQEVIDENEKYSIIRK